MFFSCMLMYDKKIKLKYLLLKGVKIFTHSEKII